MLLIIHITYNRCRCYIIPVSHVAKQTRRPVLETGHGQYHGHTEGETVRGGERWPTAVGLRRPAVEIG